MRESIIHDMPQDGMDQVVNIMTNISSNGYYGYQPKIHKGNGREDVSDVDRMEVQYTNGNNNNNHVPDEYMQINNNNNQRRDTNSRKRRSEHTPGWEFKKRRQNGQFHIQNERSEKVRKDDLLEDILRETHGISMYHWLSSQD